MVLEASRLSVGYHIGHTSRVVVHEADLDIRRGEVTALIGESGSGKTTVARTLIGLRPPGAFVAGGSVWFRSETDQFDLLGASQSVLRRLRWQELAYVPQGAASSFNPLLTIGEHFEETARSHGATRESARERAYDLLRMVRLEPRRILGSHPHELSGGTAQRAFIALALLLHPSVVVLDEPTTGLDLITQRSVVETLMELRTGISAALLLVTHDLQLATELGAEVVTMYAGRVVEKWTPRESSRPNHPYTTALLNSLPIPGRPGSAPKSIPGRPANPAEEIIGCSFNSRCGSAMDVCASGEHPTLKEWGTGSVACYLYGEINDE